MTLLQKSCSRHGMGFFNSHTPAKLSTWGSPEQLFRRNAQQSRWWCSALPQRWACFGTWPGPSLMSPLAPNSPFAKSPAGGLGMHTTKQGCLPGESFLLAKRLSLSDGTHRNGDEPRPRILAGFVALTAKLKYLGARGGCACSFWAVRIQEANCKSNSSCHCPADAFCLLSFCCTRPLRGLKGPSKEFCLGSGASPAESLPRCPQRSGLRTGSAFQR